MKDHKPLTVEQAKASLREAITGTNAGHWAHTPAVTILLQEIERLELQQMRRDVNRKREQDRRAKETPEQAAERRRKNRERMARKRAES